MKHRIQINVADSSGKQQKVLGSKRLHLPGRLVTLLFGDFSEVLILKPGVSVQDVEIHEMHTGGENLGQ